MGIREKLNQNSMLVGIAVVAVAGGAMIMSVRSAIRAGRPSIPNAGYYTVDDGKTWFVDDLNKVTPFAYDGKDAVRAYVFKCDDQGEFAAYLERFTAEGKRALEGLKARNEMGNTAALSAIYESSIEIKTPGGSSWVNRNSAAGQNLLAVKCKSGEIPEVVRP